MPQGKTHELKYLVEIPIPYVDRRGRALDRRKRSRWQRKVGAVLTECFGGFTPAPAPAMNRVQTATGRWMTLTEKGQVLLGLHAPSGRPSSRIESVWSIWSFAWVKTSIRRTSSSWLTTRIPC